MTRTATALLCVAILVSTGLAQSNAGLKLSVKAGYTTFELGSLRQTMSDALTFYESFGIPVRMQRDFPANVMAGAELETAYGGLQLGVGGSVTRTMSTFAYRDDAGSMRVRSDVSVFFVQLLMAVEIMNGGEYEVRVGLRPGIMFVSWSADERLIFNDFHELDYAGHFSASGTDYIGEPFAGIRVHIWQYVSAGVEVGMRFTSKPLLRDENTRVTQEIDLKGITIGVTAGVTL